MVTEAVVSRMKVASHNFINLHKLTNADLHEILPIPENSKIKSTLRHRDTKVALDELPSMYDQLVDLPNSKKHMRAINEFFRAVGDGERTGPNLLQNWKEQA